MADKDFNPVDQKLVQRIKSSFEQCNVLIVSNNKTTRSNLKRVLSTLGLPVNNIQITENFKTASIQMEEQLPEIIVSSLFLEEEGRTAVDILQAHKKLIPNRSKTIFAIITDKQDSFLPSFKHEFEFDSLINGVFNFQNLIEDFSKVFKHKLKQKSSAKMAYKVGECINKNEPDMALSLLQATNDELAMSEEEINLLKAQAHLLKEETDLAIEHFKKVCDQAIDYRALINLIKLFYDQRNFREAGDYCELFLNNYIPLPDAVPMFLKTLLFNKRYDDIIKLSKHYENDEDLDIHIKLNISAALALCGKSMMETNKNAAITALTDALKTSSGQSFNILQMVINSLLATNSEYDLCMKFLDQYKNNFSENKQFIALEFDVLSVQRSPSETLKEAMELIKNNIKSHRIYEELIDSSIKTGRRKEAVEDLIFEACKEFPDYSQDFKKFSI